MRRSTIVLASFVFAAAFLSMPAAATCEPSASPYLLRVGDYYVVADACQPDCLYSVWIYEETNDRPGMQRGDEIWDDTCGGTYEADTIVI